MLVGSAVRRVAIVGGLRIPFARSYSAYATASNQDMLTAVFRAVVERFKLQGERLGDVAAGAVIKHSRDYNLVRESVLSSGLDPHTPGLDMQRACGTSLEAAIDIGNKIALGQIDAGLAGGTDSISDAPIVYPRSYQQLLLASYRGRNAWQRLSPWLGLRPRHFRPVLPAVVEPRTGLSMGQSTEIMAKRWQITRAEQDQLAQQSHMKAAAAWRAGFYDDLVVEYRGLKSDNNIRADTSPEKLAKLRPSFAADGTLTAGNSTPLTAPNGLSVESKIMHANTDIRAHVISKRAWLTSGSTHCAATRPTNRASQYSARIRMEVAGLIPSRWLRNSGSQPAMAHSFPN